MFTWLNKQGVRSDHGFEVQFVGRFDAEYREGDRVVEMYVESGIKGGQPCIILESNAFERWSNEEPIDPAKQAAMLKSFKDALRFQSLETVLGDEI
jgi:hypothetical protein